MGVCAARHYYAATTKTSPVARNPVTLRGTWYYVPFVLEDLGRLGIHALVFLRDLETRHSMAFHGSGLPISVKGRSIGADTYPDNLHSQIILVPERATSPGLINGRWPETQQPVTFRVTGAKKIFLPRLRVTASQIRLQKAAVANNNPTAPSRPWPTTQHQPHGASVRPCRRRQPQAPLGRCGPRHGLYGPCGVPRNPRVMTSQGRPAAALEPHMAAPPRSVSAPRARLADTTT